MNSRLILVYNSNSGLFNSLFDYAHKIISPKTYKCNLCKITYGLVGMKKQWKSYLVHSEYDIEFTHKDELQKKYNQSPENLPAVFMFDGEVLDEVVSAREINNCQDIDDLIFILQENLRLK